MQLPERGLIKVELHCSPKKKTVQKFKSFDQEENRERKRKDICGLFLSGADYPKFLEQQHARYAIICGSYGCQGGSWSLPAELLALDASGAKDMFFFLELALVQQN